MVFIFKSRMSARGFDHLKARLGLEGLLPCGYGWGPGLLPSVPFCLLFVSFHKMAADFPE